MLNEDSSLEDLKSYLFAGTGATLGGVLTPEEVLNFIVAFDEEQQVDSTEKEQCSSLHGYNNRKRKRKVCSKKDPKQSSWYIDYILDERKEYCDPRHRNWKKWRKTKLNSFVCHFLHFFQEKCPGFDLPPEINIPKTPKPNSQYSKARFL